MKISVMQRVVKLFGSCLGLVFLLMILIAGTIVWQANRFWLQGGDADAEVVEFVVEAGTGVNTIAEELKEQGLVANKFWFKVYAKLSGDASSIKAGAFLIQPGLSYADVMDILVQAQSDDVSITIPEGLNIVQIGEIVRGKLDISQEDWELYTGADSPLESHDFVQNALKPDELDLEGYLFPDTYRFFPDATAEDVVEKMLDTMAVRFGEAGGPTPSEPYHETLTLASIIQREVMTHSEMKTVSGIFRNRLNIGMALQADSTVNYVTGKDTPAISLEDRDIDSPYNTYMYPGLPPGPISNPGVDAISAAALPEATDYFYFLTDAEGNVYYAVTHDEHVQNKNTHLR